MNNDVFTPPFYLRSTVAQTLLASSKFSFHRKSAMLENSREVLFHLPGDIRLQGFYSPQVGRSALGLAMLLHGWEGSSNSAYILRTGKVLYENGYSIFRLNYRDHGETHHLNQGLFYAVLLDEVFSAVQQVAMYESDLPFFLAGFSMGGNFALRIARKCAQNPIANLKHIASISPVLDPEKSTLAIDHFLLLRKYFRKKWSLSLEKKQSLFPDLYDFSDVLGLGTIAEMTEILIQRHSEYKNAADYFSHYTVLGNALENLTIPVTIITAQDDPIIPVEDFYNLRLGKTTDLIIHRHGGHNGFLESISGDTWYERKLLKIFSASPASE